MLFVGVGCIADKFGPSFLDLLPLTVENEFQVLSQPIHGLFELSAQLFISGLIEHLYHGVAIQVL